MTTQSITTQRMICQDGKNAYLVRHWHNGQRLGWLVRLVRRGKARGAWVKPLVGWQRKRAYHVAADKIVDIEEVHNG